MIVQPSKKQKSVLHFSQDCLVLRQTGKDGGLVFDGVSSTFVRDKVAI